MRAIKDPKSALAVLGIVAVFAIVVLVVIPRVNPPLPGVHTSRIAAGGVTRAIVDSKRSGRGGRRGGLPLSYLPNHIDFESTEGAAWVYVVRYPTGSARHEVDEMARLTEQVRVGQAPDRLVAQASGNRGRIHLNGWPYGSAKYLVLVRCETESGFEMVIHYGP